MDNKQLPDYEEALTSRIYDMGISFGISFEEAAEVEKEVMSKIDWERIDLLMALRQSKKRVDLYERISAWLPDRMAWWVSLKWPERWLPR